MRLGRVYDGEKVGEGYGNVEFVIEGMNRETTGAFFRLQLGGIFQGELNFR